MGETRISKPPERPTYPGLVKPYTDENDYVNQPKFITKKISKTVVAECINHDPFSIYDDDSSHDHYFFLPAGKLGSESKKTDINPLEKCTSRDIRCKCKNWDQGNMTTDLINEPISSKNISPLSQRCQCCKTLTQHTRLLHHNHNQKKNISHSKNNLINTKKIKRSYISGEYCSLSADAIGPKYPGILRTHDSPIEKDSLQKYTLKIVRKNSICLSDINQNSNDYHLSVKMRRSFEILDDDIISKTKNYDINKCIDQCTCMICIKAGQYHWSGDKDSFVDEPCSCIGSRKNIVGRWICMGIVSLFLPCLVCYLPAKLCQDSCSSSCCTKTKLRSKQSVVRYINGPTEKIEDNTYL